MYIDTQNICPIFYSLYTTGHYFKWVLNLAILARTILAYEHFGGEILSFIHVIDLE